MDQLREIHARSKNNAELEAPWKAERAQQEQRDRRPDADVDKPATTDKSAERIEELETELAATKSELAEERTDRRKLASVVADQAEEIKRLRAQLEAKDDPAESGASPVDTASNNTSDQDRNQRQDTGDRPWYKKMPGEAKVGLFTAGAGVVESVATATHGMSGSTEGIVASVIGLGVAGVAVVREHYKQKEGKNQ